MKKSHQSSVISFQSSENYSEVLLNEYDWQLATGN
jgi:hypothetical protein